MARSIANAIDNREAVQALPDHGLEDDANALQKPPSLQSVDVLLEVQPVLVAVLALTVLTLVRDLAEALVPPVRPGKECTATIALVVARTALRTILRHWHQRKALTEDAGQPLGLLDDGLLRCHILDDHFVLLIAVLGLDVVQASSSIRDVRLHLHVVLASHVARAVADDVIQPLDAPPT